MRNGDLSYLRCRRFITSVVIALSTQGLKVIQDRLRKVVSLKGPQSSTQRIKVSAWCYYTKEKAQNPSTVICTRSFMTPIC